MPTTTIALQDLTRREAQLLMQDELRETEGYFVQVSGDECCFRCVCCGCLVVPSATGSYDGSTCLPCGAGQDAGEDEYTRISGERHRSLIKHYTFGRGGRYSKQAREAVAQLTWSTVTSTVTFPAFAVRAARRELA